MEVFQYRIFHDAGGIRNITKFRNEQLGNIQHVFFLFKLTDYHY